MCEFVWERGKGQRVSCELFSRFIDFALYLQDNVMLEFVTPLTRFFELLLKIGILMINFYNIFHTYFSDPDRESTALTVWVFLVNTMTSSSFSTVSPNLTQPFTLHA